MDIIKRIVNGTGKGIWFGKGRFLGVHNPFGSILGKAQDPFIRSSTLNKLVYGYKYNKDISSAAINNFVSRIICDAAPKEIFDDGMLKMAQLSIDQKILGVKFKSGTIVRFSNYNPTKLYEATLANEHRIGGIICKVGTNVRFHEDGKLSEATLANEQRIGGVTCKAETIAKFHNNGKLYMATLSGDQKIRGLELTSGTIVEFNGDHWYVIPPKEQEFNGIKGKAGTRVFFDKNRLTAITLSEEKVIQGIKLMAGTMVFFGDEGEARLDSVTLSEPQTFFGIKFNGKVRLFFKYVNGILAKDMFSSAHVIEEQEIQGEKYRADIELDFDSNRFYKHVYPTAYSWGSLHAHGH
jgi:hypothetical protein